VIFFVHTLCRRNAFEIPRPIEGSTKLETLWSVIPLLIRFEHVRVGREGLLCRVSAPKNAMEIYVVGKQWMWKFQHTTGQREINELHVPSARRSN